MSAHVAAAFAYLTFAALLGVLLAFNLRYGFMGKSQVPSLAAHAGAGTRRMVHRPSPTAWATSSWACSPWPRTASTTAWRGRSWGRPRLGAAAAGRSRVGGRIAHRFRRRGRAHPRRRGALPVADRHAVPAATPAALGHHLPVRPHAPCRSGSWLWSWPWSPIASGRPAGPLALRRRRVAGALRLDRHDDPGSHVQDQHLPRLAATSTPTWWASKKSPSSTRSTSPTSAGWAGPSTLSESWASPWASRWGRPSVVLAASLVFSVGIVLYLVNMVLIVVR